MSFVTSCYSLSNLTIIYRMPFDDFCKYFTDLSICRLVNTNWFSFNKTWSEACFAGKWTAGPKNSETDRAGGCYNHKDTFLHNPQVHKTPLSIDMCI